jgi:hypothetical protein
MNLSHASLSLESTVRREWTQAEPKNTDLSVVLFILNAKDLNFKN